MIFLAVVDVSKEWNGRENIKRIFFHHFNFFFIVIIQLFFFSTLLSLILFHSITCSRSRNELATSWIITIHRNIRMCVCVSYTIEIENKIFFEDVICLWLKLKNEKKYIREFVNVHGYLLIAMNLKKFPLFSSHCLKIHYGSLQHTKKYNSNFATITKTKAKNEKIIITRNNTTSRKISTLKTTQIVHMKTHKSWEAKKRRKNCM